MAGLNFGNFDFTSLNKGGDGVSVDLPGGPYKGEIVSCEQTVAKTGRPQFCFKIKIVEHAQYNGAVRTEWIGLPNSAEDGVMKIWALAMQSIGITPEQIKGAGEISFDQIPSLFIGRTGHFNYTKGNRDLGQYDKIKFVTPDSFAYYVSQATTTPIATGTPAPAMGGGVTVQAPTGLGTGNGTSSNSLAALLGQ